jgi:hypothetical protein
VADGYWKPSDVHSARRDGYFARPDEHLARANDYPVWLDVYLAPLDVYLAPPNIYFVRPDIYFARPDIDLARRDGYPDGRNAYFAALFSHFPQAAPLIADLCADFAWLVVGGRCDWTWARCP